MNSGTVASPTSAVDENELMFTCAGTSFQGTLFTNRLRSVSSSRQRGLDNTHSADLCYIYLHLIILLTFIYIYLHSFIYIFSSCARKSKKYKIHQFQGLEK